MQRKRRGGARSCGSVGEGVAAVAVQGVGGRGHERFAAMAVKDVRTVVMQGFAAVAMEPEDLWWFFTQESRSKKKRERLGRKKRKI